MDTPNEKREPLEDYLKRLKSAHWYDKDIRRIVIEKGYDRAKLERLLSDTGNAAIKAPCPAANESPSDKVVSLSGTSDPTPDISEPLSSLDEAPEIELSVIDAPEQAPTAEGDYITQDEIPAATHFPDRDRREPYCFVLTKEWIKEDGKKYKPGVYRCSVKAKTEQCINDFICSPLWVEAETADERGKNHGMVIMGINRHGEQLTLAIPLKIFTNDIEVRSLLWDRGIVQGKTDFFIDYLKSLHAKKRMLAATRTGWTADNDNFVLPDEVIGNKAGEVILQTLDNEKRVYVKQGTLEDWIGAISKKTIGNHLLTFSLSIAFASPLLKLLGLEEGGFHFFGEISRLVAIGNPASQIPVKNLTGYTRIDPEGAKQYLFSSLGLREALKGLDFKRAIEVLIKKGILISGSIAKLVKINGKPIRCYIIDYDKLILSAEQAEENI